MDAFTEMFYQVYRKKLRNSKKRLQQEFILLGFCVYSAVTITNNSVIFVFDIIQLRLAALRGDKET